MIKTMCAYCKQEVMKRDKQTYCSYKCYGNDRKNKPNPKHSAILKKLYDENKLIHPRGMLGKHHSEEIKNKIKLGNIGKYNKHSKEGIESIRKHMQQRIISADTITKVSETRKRLFREGKLINPMLDKKRPDTSAWMKTDRNIRKFNKHPSKPQLLLFKTIKNIFSDAILEYPIKIYDKKIFWLDVAVPSQKLDFEFDGSYWHQNKDKDNARDNILKQLGWKVVRIKEGEIKSG